MNKKYSHSRLWLYFTGFVFATVFVVFLFMSGIWILLFEAGIISKNPSDRNVPILAFSIGSIILGLIIAIFVGRLIIRPIQNISDAFDELSRGNFDVKVPEKERIAEIREMAKHFNTMV